jgi:CheY-like chemotaxis protein
VSNSNVFDILVVEDDPDDLSIIIEALRNGNGKARVAHIPNGLGVSTFIHQNTLANQGALDELKLILIYLDGERRGGLNALKSIRQNATTKNTPVVVVSPPTHNHTISEAYQNGANSYITRPGDSGSCLETLSVLAHYWSTVNQGPNLYL